MKLREVTNYYNEQNKKHERNQKLRSEENICKLISEQLKNYNFIKLRYSGWGIGTITENTVELMSCVWLDIIRPVLKKLENECDYWDDGINGMIDTAFMNALKKNKVIYDFAGSIAEQNLRVFLYIDGPQYKVKTTTKKKGSKTLKNE